MLKDVSLPISRNMIHFTCIDVSTHKYKILCLLSVAYWELEVSFVLHNKSEITYMHSCVRSLKEHVYPRTFKNVLTQNVCAF